MEGKLCVVTGAGTGIGFQTCLKFIIEGARCLVAICLNEEGLGKLKQEAVALREAANMEPIEIETHVLDVTKEEEMKSLFDRISNKMGYIDLLFANAGVVGKFGRRMHDTSAEEWRGLVMRVNLEGVFIAIKHSSLHMQEGGSIIVTASNGKHSPFVPIDLRKLA